MQTRTAAIPGIRLAPAILMFALLAIVASLIIFGAVSANTDAAPLGVQRPRIQPLHVELSWDYLDDPTVTGYTVFRNNNKDNPNWIEVNTVDRDTLRWLFFIPNGHETGFRVVPQRDAESVADTADDQSRDVYATPTDFVGDTLTPVRNLKVESHIVDGVLDGVIVSFDNANFSIQKNGKVSSYNIYRDGDPVSSRLVELPNVLNGRISWLDTGAAYDTTYTYEVDLFAGDDRGTATLFVHPYDNKKASVTTPIAPPDNVALSLNRGTVNLTWDAVNAADSYAIAKRYGRRTYDLTPNGEDRIYADSGVRAGRTYSYTIRAVKMVHDAEKFVPTFGLDSSPVHVTLPKAPLYPRNLNLSWTGSGVSMDWTGQSNPDDGAAAARNDIERKVKGGTEWTLLGTSDDILYTDTTAEAGMSYVYRVTTWNDGGDARRPVTGKITIPSDE